MLQSSEALHSPALTPPLPLPLPLPPPCRPAPLPPCTTTTGTTATAPPPPASPCAGVPPHAQLHVVAQDDGRGQRAQAPLPGVPAGVRAGVCGGGCGVRGGWGGVHSLGSRRRPVASTLSPPPTQTSHSPSPPPPLVAPPLTHPSIHPPPPLPPPHPASPCRTLHAAPCRPLTPQAHPEDVTGDRCALCGRGDEWATDWISCDACDCWVHFSCDPRQAQRGAWLHGCVAAHLGGVVRRCGGGAVCMVLGEGCGLGGRDGMRRAA